MTSSDAADQRLSSPTRHRDGRAVIDVDTYVPYFFAAVNNALSRGASKKYLEQYGIGIVEWRVVAMLAIEPDITASRVCDVIALDKGATSRALSRLLDLGFLDFDAPETDPRKKIWRLNSAGYTLHDQLLVLALEREKQLLAGVAAEDLEVFLRVMRTMRRNVDAIDVENSKGAVQDAAASADPKAASAVSS